MITTSEDPSQPIYGNLTGQQNVSKESARNSHAATATRIPVTSRTTSLAQHHGKPTRMTATLGNSAKDCGDIEMTARYKAIIAATEDPLPEQSGNSEPVQKKKWKTIWPWLVLSAVLLLQTLAFTVAVTSSYQQISELRSELQFQLEQVTKDMLDQFRQTGMNLTSLLAITEVQNFMISNQTARHDALHASLRSTDQRVNEVENAANVFTSNVQTLTRKDSGITNSLNQLSTTTDRHISELKAMMAQQHSIINRNILILASSVPIGLDSEHPASSCRSLALLKPYFSTGYFWVKSANGLAERVYCVRTPDCGDDAQEIQGWQRIAHLSYENNISQCFDGLKSTEDGWCVQTSDMPGCSHTIFSTGKMNYSYVCASIIGYGINTPDAFQDIARIRSEPVLSGNYVDGISLTYNTTSKMTHIWTLASHFTYTTNCEMFTGDEEIVGTNYTCLPFKDSAGELPHCRVGSEASSEASSDDCQPKTFFRALHQVTNSDIQMRLCRDQPREDEDIAINKLDIYITGDVSLDVDHI